MRRVVTGRGPDGTSVFVADEEVPAKAVALAPGTQFWQLWGSDDIVSLPSDGTEPEWSTFFPPTNGFRFLVWSIPPDGSATVPPNLDLDTALAEVQRELPGAFEYNEIDNPGMHTTDTIDFDIVLAGELWLELDDGKEVQLGAGDCVIQNGTRHAWHNRSNAVTTIATALIGAHRFSGVSPPDRR
jgi:mannose-6-phosphate isomerase-like protein (cupin superfamily)